MSLAIRITLGLQIALAVFWNFAYLTASNSNWGILVFFILVFGAHVPLLLFAVWTFWRRPPLRRQAGWSIGIPFVSLATSLTARQAIGEPLSEAALIGILVTAIVGALLYAVARPNKAIRAIPNGLVRRRGLNWTLIVLQVLGWLFPIVIFFFIAAENAGKTMSTTDSSGMGLAYALIVAAIYFAGLGVFSLLVAVFGWLGLRGKKESVHRRLHITQLVLATPGLLIGVASVVMLVGAS